MRTAVQQFRATARLPCGYRRAYNEEMLWHDIKDLISTFGLGEEALHIYVGVALFVLILKVSRRPLGDMLPLVIVAAIAVANEALDIREAPIIHEPYEWAKGLGDIINTVLLPSLATTWQRRHNRSLRERVELASASELDRLGRRPVAGVDAQ